MLGVNPFAPKYEGVWLSPAQHALLVPQTWKSAFVKMRFQLRPFDKRAVWLNDPADIV